MAKQRPRSTIPAFRSETEERRFWETHDISPFVDWRTARFAMFLNLKPSTETISCGYPRRSSPNLTEIALQLLARLYRSPRDVR